MSIAFVVSLIRLSLSIVCPPLELGTGPMTLVSDVLSKNLVGRLRDLAGIQPQRDAGSQVAIRPLWSLFWLA